MGNFHCIPDGCGRVVYREYLPPVVRWRYPGEDWTEIEGDDYSTTRQIGQCFTTYRIEGYYSNANPKVGKCGKRLLFRGQIFGKFLGIVSYFHTPSNHQAIGANYQTADGVIHTATLQAQSGILLALPGCSARNRTTRWSIDDGTQTVTLLERTDGQPDDCGDCEFTVTLNGSVVHTETRNVCPEVEVLPCRLSDENKEIKIEKARYLERIEVRNQSIDTVYISPPKAPFLDVNQLPDECLNIYQTYILAPPILSNFVPLPGVIDPFNFIAQICSAPGCPPPEYTVICDCDCQKCPEGTCAIDCGDHICCYDTNTGIAIESIALSDYCGEVSN